MSDTSRERLVILTGPSCMGKTPLYRALSRFYPEHYNRLRRLVLYNSRSPRPGEADGVDYHFRTREQIEALRNKPRYVLMDVRKDLQALDLEDLAEVFRNHDAFFEGNPVVARILQTHPRLNHIDRLGVFVSPLSQEEILYLKDPARHVSLPDLLTDVMRRKLLRRTKKQKLELSAMDLADIETRSSSAYPELKDAWHFEYVIPNHDGEDSDNWDAFYYPLGDARKAILAFVALLEGGEPDDVEHWDEHLVP